jgi:hypothetical protein
LKEWQFQEGGLNFAYADTPSRKELSLWKVRFGIVAVYVIYAGIATAFVFSLGVLRVRISALFKTPCAMKKTNVGVLQG